MLDQKNEFFGLRYNLCCLSFGGDKDVIVINDVPLPPTPVEVITLWARRIAHRESLLASDCVQVMLFTYHELPATFQHG